MLYRGGTQPNVMEGALELNTPMSDLGSTMYYMTLDKSLKLVSVAVKMRILFARISVKTKR